MDWYYWGWRVASRARRRNGLPHPFGRIGRAVLWSIGDKPVEIRLARRARKR